MSDTTTPPGYPMAARMTQYVNRQIAAELRRQSVMADELRMRHTPVGENPDRAAAVRAYATMRDLLSARADELDGGAATPPEPTADELRTRAGDLYRRSDNVPLGRGATEAAINRVGDLRDEADQLMKRADEMDRAARITPA